MHFDVIDWEANKRLQFKPNFKYEVGIGISSRWATFVTTTGIAFFSGNKNERGITKYNDYQLNLYGKRSTSDISYQNYRGFYIGNSSAYKLEKMLRHNFLRQAPIIFSIIRNSPTEALLHLLKHS
jgi:hypothetical protein